MNDAIMRLRLHDTKREREREKERESGFLTTHQHKTANVYVTYPEKTSNTIPTTFST